MATTTATTTPSLSPSQSKKKLTDKSTIEFNSSQFMDNLRSRVLQLEAQVEREREEHATRMADFDNDVLRLRNAHQEELNVHRQGWERKKSELEEDAESLRIQLSELQVRNRRRHSSSSLQLSSQSSSALCANYEQQVVALQETIKALESENQTIRDELDLMITKWDEHNENIVLEYQQHLEQVLAENEKDIDKKYKSRVVFLEQSVHNDMSEIQQLLRSIELSQENMEQYKDEAEELFSSAITAKRGEAERLRDSILNLEEVRCCVRIIMQFMFNLLFGSPAIEVEKWRGGSIECVVAAKGQYH
eukprot:m.99101 g.99101  ORF g.99101 m.99101 type:complete len:305 (-) comp9027_c0_seq2:229-1143(-)